MTSVHFLSEPVTDDECRMLAFAGDIVVFKRVPWLLRFKTHVDAMAYHVFDDVEPAFAELEFPPDDFQQRVQDLQRFVQSDESALDMFSGALADVGVDRADSFWDRIRLRVTRSRSSQADAEPAAPGAHRDTWMTNIYAQLNWWTPLYPITRERPIIFYPAHWAAGIENTSNTWDLRKYDCDHPIADEPHVLESPDARAELRTVLEPGDLLCFSGAQLYTSSHNASRVARFSVEVRTVNASDIDSGYGAENLDGDAPHTAYRWFKHMTHNTPLSPPRG